MERLAGVASVVLTASAIVASGWAMLALTQTQLAVAGLTAASAASMLRASTELQRLAALGRRQRETP